MGRSRVTHHSADEDPAQSRSKRKRTIQNVDNTETLTTVLGMKEGKKALYHCNYCNKDISGKIRIKCVMCSDFDLCVECFSVGAEVHPHKSNHPYRVMDNLLFPLLCPEWNVDEEMLLLEGIEMYGLGNWGEVAEHVGTKCKSSCIEHYNTIYMNSPSFPLPDMSHVIGKSREELLAMAIQHGDISKGTPTSGEIGAEVESPSSARIKFEDQRKEAAGGHSSNVSCGTVINEVGSGEGHSHANKSTGAPKGVSSILSKDGHDNIKVEDRSIGEKKPRTFGEKGPSVKELSGYNSKRQEFEVEYDNDAEQLLADMEFKETDSNAELELKLRVLHIYSKRLDERKRRKDFILERNLLYPDPFEEDLTMEEKELCHHYRVCMRFHTREEHEQFLRSIIEEHRMLKRVQYLQEARAAGCCTSSQVERYMEQKIKMETEENGPRVKEEAGKYLQTKGDDIWDVAGFLGADLLSESEMQLCGEMRILPTHYLNMLQTMSTRILNGSITNKSDAHSLFNVDARKVDKVYDMLMTKDILQT